MSDPQSLFSVTLTAAELAHLVRAYRFMQHESEVPSALAALDAAKPVRATRARAPRPAAEPFSPNTGSAAVDEFMRRKHDPKYKPLPLPKAPGLPPLRPLKLREADAAEAAWNAACEKAREAVASGKPSKAETTLRELIAIHRNPWRLEATERPDYRTETLILTSPRHPGMAIHETTRDHSKTWRVMAAGALSERIHYAAAAAEIEADELA